MSLAPGIDAFSGTYRVTVDPTLIRGPSSSSGPTDSSSSSSVSGASSTVGVEADDAAIPSDQFVSLRYSFRKELLDDTKEIRMARNDNSYVFEASSPHFLKFEGKNPSSIKSAPINRDTSPSDNDNGGDTQQSVAGPATGSVSRIVSGTPAQDTDCVLLYDPITKSFTLHPLSTIFRLSNTREKTSVLENVGAMASQASANYVAGEAERQRQLQVEQRQQAEAAITSSFGYNVINTDIESGAEENKPATKPTKGRRRKEIPQQVQQKSLPSGSVTNDGLMTPIITSDSPSPMPTPSKAPPEPKVEKPKKRITKKAAAAAAAATGEEPKPTIKKKTTKKAKAAAAFSEDADAIMLDAENETTATTKKGKAKKTTKGREDAQVKEPVKEPTPPPPDVPQSPGDLDSELDELAIDLEDALEEDLSADEQNDTQIPKNDTVNVNPPSLPNENTTTSETLASRRSSRKYKYSDSEDSDSGGEHARQTNGTATNNFSTSTTNTVVPSTGGNSEYNNAYDEDELSSSDEDMPNAVTIVESSSKPDKKPRQFSVVEKIGLNGQRPSGPMSLTAYLADTREKEEELLSSSEEE